jgi:hypothetical protein
MCSKKISLIPLHTTSTQHIIIIIKVIGGNYQGEMSCPEIISIKMSIKLMFFDKLIDFLDMQWEDVKLFLLYPSNLRKHENYSEKEFHM